MTRLKKILKWTGIGLLILIAVLLSINAIWAYRSSARLEHELQLIRDEGYPTSIEEWMPDPIPDEENAAYFLDKAFHCAQPIEKEVQPLTSRDSHVAGALTDEEISVFKRAFLANPKFLTNIDRAIACEEYVPLFSDPKHFKPPLNEEWFAYVGQARSIARTLDYHGSLALAEGDSDAAMRDAIRILRVARKSDAEPFLINGLLSIAIRGIGLSLAQQAITVGDVDPTLLEELEAELASDDLMERFRYAFATERCLSMAMCDQYAMRNFWLGAKPFFDGQIAKILEFERRIIEEPSRAPELTEELRENVGFLDPLVALVTPAIDAAHESFVARVAVQRVTRIAIAIRQHEDEASLPDHPTAEDLGLDATLFEDPTRVDENLIVKRVDGEWLVYSKGLNGVDNGGAFRSHFTNQWPDEWDDGMRMPTK